MPGVIQNLIDLLAEICDEEQLVVTIKASCKAGLVTGMATMIGGLIAGPGGIVVGAVIGGTLSATACKDMKNLSQVLKELDPQKKQKLIEKINNVFKDFDVTDVQGIILAVKSNQKFKDLAVKAALDFVNNDLGLSLMN